MKNEPQKPNPEQIAEWMLEELDRSEYLYQEDVVIEIDNRFGEGFTYLNENGNLAIDKRVLNAFKKFTGDTVVWEKGERMWRKRESHDADGRAQE